MTLLSYVSSATGASVRPVVRLSNKVSACLSISWQSNSTVAATHQTKSRSEYDDPKPFHQIPGPKGLPYFGTLHQYRFGPYHATGYHNALLARYKKYGKIFKESINGETTVHLFDPNYVQTVYQNEGKNPHITSLLQTVGVYRKQRNISLGLGFSNGEDWYRLRSAVQKILLTPKSITSFLPHVNLVADDFIRRMHKIRDQSTGSIANYDNEISKWNLESSGYACFEKRIGCFESESADSWQQKIIDANAAIFRLTSKMRFSLPLHRLFPTPTWKKLLAAEDYFYSKGQSFVDDACTTIKNLIDSGQPLEGRFSLLAYFMNRKELSYSDLSVLTLSLFIDGLSTTTPSLLGQLYCLAINPEKQEKLYAELMELTPDVNEPVTDDLLQRASYLRACIKEGFRFFPVGVDVSRILQKDVVIGGYQIPAGTSLSLNNNLLLRLPEYFEEPEEYLPERWVRDGSDRDVHPYLLLPFGHGPRTCAGMRFADQEMKVLLFKLLKNFRISWLGQKKPPAQKYIMLLRPDFEPNFQFLPRV